MSASEDTDGPSAYDRYVHYKARLSMVGRARLYLAMAVAAVAYPIITLLLPPGAMPVLKAYWAETIGAEEGSGDG